MKDIIIKMMDTIFGSDFLIDCVTSINQDPLEIEGIKTLIETIGQVVLPIAAVLLCMHLLIELMDKMTSDSFNAEQFVKLLMKFVFGQIIISNATEWSMTFMTVGTKLMADIQAGLTITSIGLADITETVEAMNFWTQIGVFAQLMLPLLASFLLRIAVYFMAYSRLVEMVLRAMMSPMGCADVVTGGAHSSGIRYLKRMLAISVQGAMMLAIIATASALLAGDGIFVDGISITDVMFLGKYLGLMAAMVGLMGSSKSIANEVVGA